MSIQRTTRLICVFGLLLAALLPARADYEQDIFLVGYPSNPSLAGAEARYNYFGYLFPEVPSINATRSRFVWGADVVAEFENGKLIRQHPVTGAILPFQLPEIRSSVRLGQGMTGTAPDFVNDLVYCSPSGSYQCPVNAAYTPLTAAERATAGNQYSYGVQARSKDFYIGDLHGALSTAYQPMRLDVYLQVQAPVDHRLLYAPSASSANVKVKEASWIFDPKVVTSTGTYRQDQLKIFATAVGDRGEALTIGQAARAMGYDSINFINKITRSNVSVPSVLKFPESNPGVTDPITVPVTDPPLGGVVGSTGDGKDFEIPYYNITVNAAGAGVMDTGDHFAAFLNEQPPDVATSIGFQDSPGGPVAADGTNSMDVSFWTVMVGVRSSCTNAGFATLFPGQPTVGTGCFSYEVIGNKVFGWRSMYGEIKPPTQAPYFGPTGEPDPAIQLQRLVPLDDMADGQSAAIDALSFAEFEDRYGISPDQYFVQGLPPTRSPSLPVPEADALHLFLGGLATLGLMGWRRRSARSN